MVDELFVLAKWLEGQPLDRSSWWQLGEYLTLQAAGAAGDAMSTRDDLLAVRQGQRTVATRVPGESWQFMENA